MDPGVQIPKTLDNCIINCKINVFFNIFRDKIKVMKKPQYDKITNNK